MRLELGCLVDRVLVVGQRDRQTSSVVKARCYDVGNLVEPLFTSASINTKWLAQGHAGGAENVNATLIQMSGFGDGGVSVHDVASSSKYICIVLNSDGSTSKHGESKPLRAFILGGRLVGAKHDTWADHTDQPSPR